MNEARFTFWCRWLLVISGSLIAMGVYVAFAKDTFVFRPCAALIDPVFWPAGAPEAGTVLFQGFVYSVWGASIIAWGIQLLFVTRFAFRARQPWAWWSILVSTLAWYPIGAGFSVYFKMYVNALANSLFLPMLLLPLFMTRAVFFAPRPEAENQPALAAKSES